MLCDMVYILWFFIIKNRVLYIVFNIVCGEVGNIIVIEIYWFDSVINMVVMLSGLVSGNEKCV